MAGGRGGSPSWTEHLALQHGLSIMWELGIRDAKMDCLEIVEVSRDGNFQFHELVSEFWDIHGWLQREWRVQLVHVPRSPNEVEDCLAGLGSDAHCPFLCLEDLHLILARDLLVL